MKLVGHRCSHLHPAASSKHVGRAGAGELLTGNKGKEIVYQLLLQAEQVQCGEN